MNMTRKNLKSMMFSYQIWNSKTKKRLISRKEKRGLFLGSTLTLILNLYLILTQPSLILYESLLATGQVA
jgi:hypothetical protein